MKNLFILILLTISQIAIAQDPYPVNTNIDILHYSFKIDLNDSDNQIDVCASIRFRINQPENLITLDLVNEEDDKGMKVTKVYGQSGDLDYTHKNDKLSITCPDFINQDTCFTIFINYNGEPKDGLIISDNKFGKKSFFGDNWPDRGRNWLACVDHVSDKATVEFIVKAPSQYQVISNGYRKANYTVEEGIDLTHYVSTVPLPTKVMVIGVSTFAVETVGFSGDTPIETWVYPENRENGFLDYAPAVEIVDFFSAKIGDYAFEKLANVQSKTVYGGMENSGAIFYYENSVSGKNRLHGLLAHEIAHQWFGDAVTEKDWHHIWLSEGFATYLEAVCTSEYMLLAKLSDKMNRSRQRVTSYYHRNPKPVVDTTIVNFRRLLSTNSYQKGAWVLHMLRNELGEDVFWKGIRQYYKKYMNSNALTRDFRYCMEEASQKNLHNFFDQWLFQAGHPVLNVELDPKKTTDDSTTLKISQEQDHHIFSFPLEITLLGKNKEETKLKVFTVDKKEIELTFDNEFKVVDIVVDPNVKLLYETSK